MTKVTYRMWNLLLLVVCSSIVSSTCRGTYGANKCPHGEEWNKCGVVRTCWNLDQAPKKEHCYQGCFCPEGRVKNKDGRCVLPSECVKYAGECGENEEYTECGTACPRTCESLYSRIKCEEKCVPGCFCKGDLVRHEEKCIDIRECQPQLCGLNEEFNECGSGCPETCSTLGHHQTCSDQCKKACFCKEGFVRDDSGICIQRSQCPALQKPPDNGCGIDEEPYRCIPTCRHTCDNYNATNPVCPHPVCIPGCFCRKGLVKNRDGKCVPTCQCEQKTVETCGLNEEYTTCGSACPPTCSSLADGEPQFCTQQCVPGCFCRKGFVRNEEGQCVEPSQCSKKKCEENEKYDTCGSACPVTCANKDRYVACTQQCKIGCFCKEGYVKNDQGKCIPPEQCPSGNNECSGLNEVMSDCAKPKSCNTCEIRGNCNLKRCARGCDCKPGYFRNSSGICVQEALCPVNGSAVSDCSLPPYTGPCKGLQVRFYYDAASKQCKTFTFGGCQGNSNNFKSEQECIRKCGREKVEYDCEKEAESGEGNSNLRRFYFNSSSGECRAFTYGGSGGNKNNFRNKKECISKCKRLPVPGSIVSGRTRSVCDLSPSEGPCTSFVNRYFFNKASGTCETFKYGGCEGNENNFQSEDECYQQCGVGSSKLSDCYQPPERGHCKSMERRFYFAIDSGECKSFNYGGCGGNSNNFKTAAECQRKCGRQCGQNERFSSCGSACPLTCDNQGKPQPCILSCKIGCICKDGYVRDAQGKCIPPDQCPKGNGRGGQRYSQN